MTSLNKVLLIGNLGADPELRYTQDQTPVATLRIATTKRWKNDGGEAQEKTEWHNVIVWRKTAEACAKYLAKGRQVYVEGELQTRKWQDKQGQDRWTTEIVANDVQFLGSGNKEAGAGAQPNGARGQSPSREPGPDVNDIPF